MSSLYILVPKIGISWGFNKFSVRQSRKKSLKLLGVNNSNIQTISFLGKRKSSKRLILFIFFYSIIFFEKPGLKDACLQFWVILQLLWHLFNEMGNNMNKCYLGRALDLICLHTGLWKIVNSFFSYVVRYLVSQCPFRVFWPKFIKSREGIKCYKQLSLVQHLKFIFSEKATKFNKISTVDLIVTT